MSKEYAFDIELRGAVRVQASSEAEARALLSGHMDAMNCNGGAWAGGQPIVFEASIVTDKVARHERLLHGFQNTLHRPA